MLVEVILGKETGERALAAALDFVRAHPQDADRGQRPPRLLHLARRRHLSPRGPPDAGRGRAAGDDRECRAHGRHAGRPARAQRRGRASTSPGRSCRRPKPISAPRRSTRAEGSCSTSMVEKRGRSAARTARAFTIIPRAARSGCGPASPICRRQARSRRASTSQELKQRFLGIQALETARCFEEGVLTDVREADVGSILGFGFAPFTGGTLSYIDGMGTAALRRAAASGLRARCGPRFTPTTLLARHGGKGRDLLRPLRAAQPRSGGVRE